MELCMLCGKNPVAVSATKLKSGRVRYRKRCEVCIKQSRAIRLNGHRNYVLAHKKSYCEECGFVAVDKCQLDVDHIDGNRLNQSPDNFRTLCANCHRLKTKLNGDNIIYGKNHVQPVGQGDLLEELPCQSQN
jgi:5-methylcytosine-specific restriction endonuclease McrA